MQQQERSEWGAGWEEASASARSRKEVSVVRGSYLNVRSCFGSQYGTLPIIACNLNMGNRRREMIRIPRLHARCVPSALASHVTAARQRCCLVLFSPLDMPQRQTWPSTQDALQDGPDIATRDRHSGFAKWACLSPLCSGQGAMYSARRSVWGRTGLPAMSSSEQEM